MDNCYVILRHRPVSTDPTNVHTETLGVASTLFLAEVKILNDLSGSFDTSLGLECYIEPTVVGTPRTYYLRGYGGRVNKDGYHVATSYTVEEFGIENDLASLR